MTGRFRIVFKGELLEGFALEDVQIAAGKKLGASPEQARKLFSGKRATLKKGIEEAGAQKYLQVLGKIGMKVYLEAEEDDLIGAITLDEGASDMMESAPAKAPVAEPAFDPAKTQIARFDSLPPIVTGRKDTASAPANNLALEEFDPEKTLIASPEAVASFLTGAQQERDTEVVREPAPANAYDPDKTELVTSSDLTVFSPPTAPLAVPVAATKEVPTADWVTCPTCGDHQPKKLLCRRCGHSLMQSATQEKAAPTAERISPKRRAAEAPAQEPAASLKDMQVTAKVSPPENRNITVWLIAALIIVLGGAALWFSQT